MFLFLLSDAFTLTKDVLKVANLTKYNTSEYHLWVTATDGKFETNVLI